MMSSQQPLPMETDCQSVKARLERGERFLLLDCRDAKEYQLVRIEAATHVPMTELDSRLTELESFRNSPVVVHCHHGGRSLRVANWLREKGFAQAQSMAGGIDKWAQEIEPGIARY